MGYTKDIILDVNYKKQLGTSKLRKWTSKVKKILMNNKIVVIFMSVLISLIAIDIILVNSFLQLLTKLY